MPGPTPHFLFGNAAEIGKFGFAHAIRNWFYEHGKIFRFWIGFRPFVVVCDPKLTQDILMNESNRGPAVDNLVRVWGGHNLFTMQPPMWNERAKFMRPAFKLNIIRELLPKFSQVSINMLELWEEQGLISPSKNELREFDVLRQLTKMCFDIIGITSFGYNFDCLHGKGIHLHEAFEYMMEATVKSFAEVIPIWRIYETSEERKRKQYLQVLFDQVQDVMNERRKQTTPSCETKDLMQLLMESVDPDTGDALSDRQIQCEVMAFWAGHDTAASTLAFFFYLLATNPEVQKNVRKEISNQSFPLGWDSLKTLTYTEMALKESQRMYPVAALIQRGLTTDQLIGPYFVRKGTVVITPPFATHVDEAYFKDPFKFQPERFDKEKERALPSFCFFPYGGGPRMCMGWKLIQNGMLMIIATLLQSLEVVTTSNTPQNLEVEYLFSLKPKGNHLSLAFVRS